MLPTAIFLALYDDVMASLFHDIGPWSSIIHSIGLEEHETVSSPQASSL